MTKSGAPNDPHDKFFKFELSKPAVARDFLESHLPRELLAVCDMSTLKLEPGSYIDGDLQAYCSDILWSMHTRQGKPGYIYTLIEHQSTPDKLMPLRLLHYALAIMFRHIKIHKRPPLVIPILFYAGQQTPYPYSLRWFDVFDDSELMEKIYSNPFPLIDITTVPDAEISRHRKAAYVQLLLKNVKKYRLEKLLEILQPVLVTLLRDHYTDTEEILPGLYYLISAGESDNSELFINKLIELLPQHEDKIMTIAEELIAKGREQGRVQGWEQGRVQGWEQGRMQGWEQGKVQGEHRKAVEMAQRLMKMGMSYEVIRDVTGLSDAELHNIKK